MQYLKYLLTFVLFSFTCVHAEPEYDIFVVAPQNDEQTYGAFPWKLTEDGYIVGDYWNLTGDRSNEEIPFVYHHPTRTFQSIDIPIPNVNYAKAISINSNGLAVGEFTRNGYCYGCDEGVFIYNIHTQEFVDILSHPDLEGRNDKFLNFVGISDNNTVFSRHHNNTLGAFSYNNDMHTVSFDVRDSIEAVNPKGQMIGGRWSWITENEEDGWFFDPVSGYQKIESLDQAGLSSVEPIVLSDNGFVSGPAVTLKGEDKGFLWSQKTGLIKIDKKNRDGYWMEKVNDLGEVVGDFWETSGNYEWHAFVFTKEKKTIDLGTLIDTKNGVSDSSWALGINNASQVVGEYRQGYENDHRAFIWDAKQGVRDLITLIPSNTGWNALTSALSINNDGWIAGVGLHKGKERVFLLVPREGVSND